MVEFRGRERFKAIPPLSDVHYMKGAPRTTGGSIEGDLDGVRKLQEPYAYIEYDEKVNEDFTGSRCENDNGDWKSYPVGQATVKL